MDNIDNLYWSIVGSVVTSLIALLFASISPFNLKNRLIMIFSFFSFHKYGSEKYAKISGVWKAKYNNELFPNDPSKQAERFIRLRQIGSLIAGFSISPNSNVKIEGRIVFHKYFYGTYIDKKENTVYYGTFQVSYDFDKGIMKGRWIGFNNKGENTIGHGIWEWEKVHDTHFG